MYVDVGSGRSVGRSVHDMLFLRCSHAELPSCFYLLCVHLTSGHQLSGTPEAGTRDDTILHGFSRHLKPGYIEFGVVIGINNTIADPADKLLLTRRVNNS